MQHIRTNNMNRVIRVASRIGLICLVLICSWSKASAASPHEHTSITGIVQKADGSPAEGAIVISEYGGQAVTDQRGAFVLDVAVPDDALTVSLTAVATIEGRNLIGTAHAEWNANRRSFESEPIPLSGHGSCTPGWIATQMPTIGYTGSPSQDLRVQSFAIFDDGTGPALYVGGQFSIAGGVQSTGVLKWDGTKWNSVGNGIGLSQGLVPTGVRALAVFNDGSGDALYVGGSFTRAGGQSGIDARNIAKWDGQQWHALGLGIGTPGGLDDSYVSAMAVFDDGSGPALYVGGRFTRAGGSNNTARRIARWDGQQWSTLSSGGTDGVTGSGSFWTAVHALAVYDDGSGQGEALYVGGRFTSAGGVTASRIAKWDGVQWSPLLSGVTGGSSATVFALAVYDDGTGQGEELYVGGQFSSASGVSASNIARWNGSAWSSVGSGASQGVNDMVQSLAVFDANNGHGPALFVGGRFTTAGGTTANRVARWDGNQWSPLFTSQQNGVSGGFNTPEVLAFGVFDDGFGAGPGLYVGGHFVSSPANNSYLARWQGCPFHTVAWSAVGSGMNNWVGALEVFDDGTGPAIYAAGIFTTADGNSANRIAVWNGAGWSPLDSSAVNGAIRALAVYDDGTGPALYVGGSFTTIGSVTVNRVARWDGMQWSALGSGPNVGTNGTIRALGVYDDGSGPALYAGGQFSLAGGVQANNIARWDGQNWTALGDGIGGSGTVWVYSMETFDDGTGSSLYVGGLFTQAGSISASRIARWDGQQWHALGSGLSNAARDMAVFDDGTGPALYVGGDFSTADGITVNHIARWDGSLWSALGGGTNSNVFALRVFDDGLGVGPALYAGGWLMEAGGVPANRIARWDGAQWSALGDGLGPANAQSVMALRDFDDGSGPALFVGGGFTIANGAPGNRIAAWRGEGSCAEWRSLDLAPTGGWFTTLAIYQDNANSPGTFSLYGGGHFSGPGAPDNFIARWDCDDWLPVGGGLNWTVRAMTVHGGSLYVAGDFGTAGGQTAFAIARWNGNQWFTLVSGSPGIPGQVYALAVYDDGSGPALYVGGSFDSADGVAVNNIARWSNGQWTPVGSGVSGGTIMAMTVYNGELYVGGTFNTAGGSPAQRIARWNGSTNTWSTVEGGVTGNVFALTTYDDGSGTALYAGGNFVGADGIPANRIARWDGANWSPLGLGMNNSVYALSAFDDGNGPALFAGGDFTSAAGLAASRIARWNGSQWSSLGSDFGGGVDLSVNAFAVSHDGSTLYVAGGFTTAGSLPVNAIAAWGCTANICPGTVLQPLGDLNGDGVVDVQDLLILFNSWGQCDDCDDCPADLNGDCVVDVKDLLILFNNWG